MGQGDAFGKTGRPGCVLDVDVIVRVQVGRNRPQFFVRHSFPALQDVFEAEDAILLPVDQDHIPEGGQEGRIQPARRGARDLGADLQQHLVIPGGLERMHQDERLCAGLLQGIPEFVRPIGGIDVHENRPDLGGRKLQGHPFPAVDRPDAYTVPLLDPQLQQPLGQLVGHLVERAVGEAPPLMRGNERFFVGMLSGNAPETFPDGQVEQRHIDRPVLIT